LKAGASVPFAITLKTIYEHANPSVKPMLAMFFMFFGFFVGFGFLIRVLAAIVGSFPNANKK
jgi:hypothetical protein